jgi:ankyrin repeat protein
MLAVCRASERTKNEAALFHAIDANDTNAVKGLIGKGVNINVRNRDGYTALYCACEQKNADLVKILLHAGAKVNARFGYDGPALIWEMDATGEENITDTAVVAALLAGGADVNARNSDGESALARAFINPHGFDNSNAILLLINAGANPNVKDNEGYTSLWWWHDDVTVYKALLKHGADVNAKSKDGRTPLMNVSNDTIASMLIKAGADVNAQSIYGETPLIEACSQGNPGVVAVLLEAGADVNARLKIMKLTALGYAMKEKKYFDGELKKNDDASSSEDVVRFQKVIDLLKQHGAKE